MLAATKDKVVKLGRWLGRVLGAAAPFIPDPKAKLAAGAAAAVLGAATAEPEPAGGAGADDDPIVEKGDSA